MMKKNKAQMAQALMTYFCEKLVIGLLLTMSTILYAEPWFTQPLFALSGQAMPLGQSSLEWYNYYTTSTAIYDANWQKVSIPRFTNVQIAPEFTYGLAQHMDVEYDFVYIINQNESKSDENLGDTSIILGYQFLEQTPHRLPDARLTIEQIFPTGRHDHLNPKLYGTDATGEGSYQTLIGLNFENLIHFPNDHYLNAHATFTYDFTSVVKLKGFSIYGGTPATRGYINPGNSITIDLAGEYTLTQHWVAVLEGLWTYQNASSFHGFIGTEDTTSSKTKHFKHKSTISHTRLIPSLHNIGRFDIGSGNNDQFTFAPAIEYNFSEKLGIIGGTWFTVTGKNSPALVSSIISLVINWQ